jgi:hypothetical protein
MDPAALRDLMDTAGRDRDKTAETGDLWANESKLYDNRYIFHAERLMKDLDKLDKPNGADNLSFQTPLDGRIASAFNAEQLGRVLQRLPFGNPSFAVHKDGFDLKLIVPRDEVLQYRRNRQERPAAVKDGGEAQISASAGGAQEKPKKASLMAALDAGEKKSREQFGGKPEPDVDALKKGAKKNGLEDF